jgi:hypothetical protein
MIFPTEGIHHQYVKMHPEILIVKVQGVWDGTTATIKAVVNFNYEGEIYYEETADLIDGDRIYATPVELVVLRGEASEDNVESWDGRHICLGLVHQNALILYPTVAP